MALLQPVAQKLGLTTITSESRHASPLKKRLETKKKKDNTPSYVPERLRIYEENSEDKDAPQTADLQSYNEAIFDHETPLPQGVTFIKDEDLDKMLEKNKIVADINKIPASKTPLKTLLENAKEAQPYFQQYVQTDETFKNGFSEGKASKNQFKKHVKEGIAKMNVFVDPKTKKPIISFHVFDDQYLSKESEQEKIGTKNASYMFNVILKSPKDLATLKKWVFEQQRAALKNGNQKAAATFAFFQKQWIRTKNCRI